jgi:hypothetical protein
MKLFEVVSINLAVLVKIYHLFPRVVFRTLPNDVSLVGALLEPVKYLKADCTSPPSIPDLRYCHCQGL